jgi:hypothetical protein
VKNASHLDHAILASAVDHAILAAAIQDEMPGFLHTRTAHSGAAEFEGPSARPCDHDLRPLFGAWALRIGSDIAQRLLNKSFVA